MNWFLPQENFIKYAKRHEPHKTWIMSCEATKMQRSVLLLSILRQNYLTKYPRGISFKNYQVGSRTSICNYTFSQTICKNRESVYPLHVVARVRARSSASLERRFLEGTTGSRWAIGNIKKSSIKKCVLMKSEN